jgi:hypothetical protein
VSRAKFMSLSLSVAVYGVEIPKITEPWLFGIVAGLIGLMFLLWIVVTWIAWTEEPKS